MEIWKDILEHNGYQISNYGNVRSFKSMGPENNIKSEPQRMLKPHINSNGYWCVCFRHGNKINTKEYVHRLIGKYFIANPLNSKQINHKDGNKLNNSIENLEWVTCSENVLHARHVLRKAIGDIHHKAKLSELKVKDIRHFIELGLSDTDIGVMYNVHRRTISDVRLGKTWVGV